MRRHALALSLAALAPASCFSDSGTLYGCCSSDASCGEGQACERGYCGGPNPRWSLGQQPVCETEDVRTCDVHDPNACGDGEKCQLILFALDEPGENGEDFGVRYECRREWFDPVAPGQACTVSTEGDIWDTCAEGSFCVGTCLPFCDLEAGIGCTDPDLTCANVGLGIQLEIDACLRSCDPFQTDNCGPGTGPQEDTGDTDTGGEEAGGDTDGDGAADDVLACYNLAASTLCAPTRIPESRSGNYRSACELPNSCQDGLTCVDWDLVPGCTAVTQRCCTRFCQLSQPNTCDGKETDPDTGEEVGQVCVALYEPAPDGLEDVGLCLRPLEE